MTDHSPEPWQVASDLKPGHLLVLSAPTEKGYSMVICTVLDSEEFPAIADARLIAAAPAYRQAWEMVPGAMQARILRMLNDRGEGWVQEAIIASKAPSS